MISIGIDLGTTNSSASYLKDEKPEVIPNSEGEMLTPSMVSYFQGPGGKSQMLVGRAAVNYSVQAPRDSIYSVKRLMGLSIDHAKVQEIIRRVPYQILAPLDEQDIGAQVVINDERMTPIDISALILRKIKEDSEKRLGRPIEGATITVPAYFLDNQRNATKDAGQLAGFRLHPLLDEPIAAALSFGCGREDKERILVYDLGGGTFDVSLIQMAAGNLQVLSKRGDMWLGGDDFDQVIVRQIMEWLNKTYKCDSIEDPVARRKIKQHAEHAKKVLSQHELTQVLEPCLTTLPNGQTAVLDVSVSRESFDAGITPLIRRSLELVDEVLDEATVLPQQLTGILLVGGSTLVPHVRRMLSERFGANQLRTEVDPMTCVSLGAAIWCERFPLQADGRINRTNYIRTGIPTPMDLGVEIYRDGNCHHFEVVVPRNTPYPTAKKLFDKPFFPTSENQRLIRIPIFQGNSNHTSLNSYQGLIEETLPVSLPARTPVYLSFAIDEHGNLSGDIEFRDHHELTRSWSIRRNQAPLSEEEQQRLKTWKVDAQETISVAEGFYQQYAEYMTASEAAHLRKLLEDIRTALESDNRVSCQTHRRALEMAMLGCGTASILFLAKRSQQLAGTSGVAKEVARNRVLLEAAFKSGDQAEVDRLTGLLNLAIHQVFEIHAPGKGPLPGQLTLGSL